MISTLFSPENNARIFSPVGRRGHILLVKSFLNRQVFWGVRNSGLGAVTHWKIFLWKIIHMYIGVVSHQRFFEKGVTKKKIFFRDHFYLVKMWFCKSLLKAWIFTRMGLRQTLYLVKVTWPKKLMRTSSRVLYRCNKIFNFFPVHNFASKKFFYLQLLKKWTTFIFWGNL